MAAKLGFLNVLDAYSGIDFGILGFPMTKQLLHGDDIGPIAQKMRGACVPPEMRPSTTIQARSFGITLDDTVNRRCMDGPMRKAG